MGKEKEKIGVSYQDTRALWGYHEIDTEDKTMYFYQSRRYWNKDVISGPFFYFANIKKAAIFSITKNSIKKTIMTIWLIPASKLHKYF